MLQHDVTIWISEGHSREEKSWKNKELLWSELTARLQKSCQTSEKFKDYQKLDKDQQGIIKDVGGFVGGVVTGGRRVKGSVGTRFLLTLDLDYAPPGFWRTFPLVYNNAAFLHATHAHSEEKPRLRLIMPFARQVYADEYEAVARRVAGDLGIDYFDDTTFQVERLMYWPSSPKDVQYYWKQLDRPVLDPDKVLARYHNWKDFSQWPLSSRVKEIPQKLTKQQEDPHEKSGVIGAFCRSFTIQEVIDEYLSDVYESTDDDNRYTYMQGTASKGLVIYEDKFAYSHHGTDPISGKLCNAFDLVRLHLYGGLDTDKDVPVNKQPSFKAMSDLALKNSRVVEELGVEKMERLNRVFAEGEDKSWLKELEYDQNSKLKSTIRNAYLIIKNDPELKECFAHNVFAHTDVAMKDLPWRSVKREEPLTDDDDACLRAFLEEYYGNIAEKKIDDAFRKLMVEKSYNPIRDYLEGLTWDGKPRIDTLLMDFFGCDDTEYVRTVTRKTLVAAVARIFEPGITFHTVLILVGAQGKGKSSFIRKLGGQWFTDTFGPLDNPKAAMDGLQGKWIIEIGELAAFKGKEAATIKLFVAKETDWFRVSFGKRNQEFPRQCFFIGTTNEMDVLNDATGDRRFWPVLVNADKRKLDPRNDLSAHIVRQVWAEALQMYRAKETLYLTDEMEERAKLEKTEFRSHDPREDDIEEFLKMRVPDEFYSMSTQQKRFYYNSPEEWTGKRIYKTTINEIWELVFNGKKVNATKYNTRFIKDFFTSRPEEWENRVIKVAGRAVRGSYRVDKGPVTFDDLL